MEEEDLKPGFDWNLEILLIFQVYIFLCIFFLVFYCIGYWWVSFFIVSFGFVLIIKKK